MDLWKTANVWQQMYLRQPGFTYSACRPLAKNKERINKFWEIKDSRYNYQNKLDKACFQHDMAYGDFKDLNKENSYWLTYYVIKHLTLLRIQNLTDINFNGL